MTASMYPFSSSEDAQNPDVSSSGINNTSCVDVFNSAGEEFPDFWENVVPKAMSIILKPGDLLYIPPGWWHAMRSVWLLVHSSLVPLLPKLFRGLQYMLAMNVNDLQSLPNSHSDRWSSFASTTLSSVHIAQAIQRSSDDGATLMFSKMNLSDVGVAAVEELARIGKERSEDESLLKRHNKIKGLPIEAGHLVHLRVFSLARNKITQLPPYLAQFPNLEVLEVERNPIEWPPKSVMEKADSLDSRNAMKDWVRSLQQWIEVDSHSQIHDESGFGEQQERDFSMEENYHSWKFPLRENGGFTPHNRSFSVGSGASASSTSDSNREPEVENPSLPIEVDHPSHLRLGILGTFSAEHSPTRALQSYLPSPADSESFDGNLIPTSLEHYPHARNASYSTGTHSLTFSNLAGKQSMPDLRNTKLDFGSKKSIGLIDVAPASASTSQEPSSHDIAPSTLPEKQDSDSLSSHRADGSIPETSRRSPTQTSMASQRNSYFYRLSSLPISMPLPQPLLCLVESARSILFAACQVFQTLEYLIAHAIDYRISSVLRKVLDPASIDMTQLINSLERFDATSRISLPSPTICRGVLESCRNTIAVFSKAVGVLALQLQVIVTGDDIRYSRWILLELYGATAELASAWEIIAPHIEAIRPFLHSKTSVGQPSPLVLNSSGGDVYSVSPASIVSLPSDSLALLRTQPGVPRLNEGVRTARRHAGSFSSKDVEIGKKLPSYDDVPGLFGGVVSGTARSTPIPRAPKRQATLATTSISSPSSMNPTLSFAHLPSIGSAIGDSPRALHSRQSSQASFQTSASSSPLLPTKANYLDLPSKSKLQVDKEALQAVQAAVSIAPSVWDMIETLFYGDLNTKSMVHGALEKARVVTARLNQTLQVMQVYDFDVFSDRKDFREDAHAFLKIVVQLSNIIKTYRGPNFVSSTLRTGMVKLTNSTEEFAILLHVSSFAPSATPRPYTPLITNSLGPEDLRLDSSLSRSKSAHHSGSFKSPGHTHDGSRSALPSETFKLPITRQLRSREGVDSPTADPG
ncbi:hypothetical protein C0989_008965 [Termitomyces sp. Mn162]|nr:hypothetical protein C0989_008965 [Termitomyces sp. Mn162]